MIGRVLPVSRVRRERAAWYALAVASEPVPDCVTRLFWDVDPAEVDLDAHADYVLERVMSRGSWEAMRWLRRRYTARVCWLTSSVDAASGSRRATAHTGRS